MCVCISSPVLCPRQSECVGLTENTAEGREVATRLDTLD